MSASEGTKPASGPNRARANEADWYDRFYAIERGATPWHHEAFACLRPLLQPDATMLEVGCGQGQLLRMLAEAGLLDARQMAGIDQSGAAIRDCQRHLPEARFEVADAYALPHADASFDFCVMLEVIEHFVDPELALREVRRVLKPGGRLCLSFPNYLHLPWLLVRVLAELMEHPNWICLQPIDRIYAVPWLLRRLRKSGFVRRAASGSLYAPPVLYVWEKRWMSRLLNRLGLWAFSFHPVIVLERMDQEPGTAGEGAH
jgi:ubiquinone/menaquinone biosynthesis C-methylase UbiE